MWQFNVDFGLDRGVRDITVSLSSDGNNFVEAVSGLLLKAAGRPVAAQRLELAGDARYVRLDLGRNHGDQYTWTGLPEVRFDGVAAAVPEPAKRCDAAPADGGALRLNGGGWGQAVVSLRAGLEKPACRMAEPSAISRLWP